LAIVSANEKAGFAGAAGAAFFSIDFLLPIGQPEYQTDGADTYIAAATTEGVAVLATAFLTPAPVEAEMTDLVTTGFAFTEVPTTAGFAATAAAAGFEFDPTGSARFSTEVFAAALPVAGVMSTRFEAVSDDALPGAARLTPAMGSGVGLLLGGDFMPGCCSLLA
jgi:hypothetical protein